MNIPILIGTAAAAIYAVGVCAWRNGAEGVAWLNAAYYLLLVFNTYFSLDFTERAFHVRNLVDGAINAPLAAFYLTLPWLVGGTARFHWAMAAFFTCAVLKYTAWIKVIDSPFFLRRKISANTGGSLLSLMVLGALYLGGEAHTFTITLVAVVVYAVANVWVLWVDPLYREK